MLSAVLDADLKKYEGGTLEQIGALMKKDPRDALMDIVLADRANSYCILFMMSEDDVKTALAMLTLKCFAAALRDKPPDKTDSTTRVRRSSESAIPAASFTRREA